MLMIRKINQKEQDTFREFCKQMDVMDSIDSGKVFMGIYINDQLQGYAKIDFDFSPLPLIKDLQIIDRLEPSSIEGLLRGALHYCYAKGHKKIAIQDTKILEDYLEEALKITEKESYNDIFFHTLDLNSFFNKPCKGRSLCL